MAEAADAPERRRPTYFDSAAQRSRYGLDTAGATTSASATSHSPTGTPQGSQPSTPLPQLARPLSGTWTSPGGAFRADDEVFVIELGARFLRVGFGGEAAPRARMPFGPATQARAGDYAALLPGARPGARTRPNEEDVGAWGGAWQLYPTDLRAADMKLIGLRLERAVRTAATQHVLAIDDSKRRVVALAIQPQLPHPLLKEVLETLFGHFPSPYQIAMLSTPLCSTVAAGLRSALVVDIGWNETLVSAVYEMRELEHRRSERAMRRLNWAVANFLVRKLDEQNSGEKCDGVTFEDSEEVIWRMCHCRKSPSPPTSAHDQEDQEDPLIDVSLPSQDPTHTLPIPFSHFAQPVESTFFTSTTTTSNTSNTSSEPITTTTTPTQDDDNLAPLPHLLYTTLLRLPPDVRGALLPRILITGGGAHIPRLKARLTAELAALIARRSWDPVQSYGSAKKWSRLPVSISNGADTAAPTTTSESDTDTVTGAEREAPVVNKDIDASSTTPASEQPPLPDDVLAKIRRNAGTARAVSDGQKGVQVAAVRTLGAWAGASLLSGLRQRGVVEVEKDIFMAQGLAGADREGSGSVGEEAVKRRSREQEKRQSMIAGGRVNDRKSGSWTLGAWA